MVDVTPYRIGTRATTEEKARIVGRALASGAMAANDAAVDEAMLVMRVVKDLGPPDFRVLDHLARLPWPPADGPRPVAMGLEFVEGDIGFITLAGLAHEMGGAHMLMLVEASKPVLERHGLLEFRLRVGATTLWRASALGLMILNFVLRHTTDPDIEEDPPTAGSGPAAT